MYFDINVYYTMFPAYMPENLLFVRDIQLVAVHFSGGVASSK